MFANMVASLLRDERIQTTEAKAKELRRLAERTIGWGLSVAELTERDVGELSPDERAAIVHAMRMAKRVVRDSGALHRVFHELAVRFKGRRGGYTRLLKLGRRAGDAAPVTLVELV